MDKNIIEMISDPLLHILRNSIDHGIENPDERIKAGKPETGQIELKAKYEGSDIWIIVSDDGAGLNRKKIIQKAVEKSLINPEGIPSKDEEIWKLIFYPGFSTSDTVTELSGRGVGMDVVNRNIEKLKGRIDIHSEEGKGTQITLKIPITLAIIDGIILRAGDGVYIMPVSDTLEFFRYDAEKIIQTEENQQMVRLRDEVYPVIHLQSYFEPGREIKNSAESDPVMALVQADNRKAVFQVSEIIGSHQIVIKSISEYLGDIKGISGCTILGDGNVSLIIDTGKVLNDLLL